MSGDHEVVILVDADDREVGTAPKLAAHHRGERHRAISVFVLDGEGRVLLQRRANGKYHSGGRWANTACSHPRPGEAPLNAARRCLREEMGIDCPLEPVGVFTYRAEVGGGLVEHEVDHVFAGRSDMDPAPDPSEVQEWRWMAPDDIVRELNAGPDAYAAWFAPAFSVFLGTGSTEASPGGDPS